MRISDWSSDVCSSDLILKLNLERLDRDDAWLLAGCLGQGRCVGFKSGLAFRIVAAAPYSDGAADGRNHQPGHDAGDNKRLFGFFVHGIVLWNSYGAGHHIVVATQTARV